eukprot:INCI12474.1.p1 GENE.INCI12474.1~~INCI12474.1.p1  ORF type:complete len:127 (-),score=43.49 INCI12474.1:153-533(-)
MEGMRKESASSSSDGASGSSSSSQDGGGAEETVYIAHTTVDVQRLIHQNGCRLEVDQNGHLQLHAGEAARTLKFARVDVEDQVSGIGTALIFDATDSSNIQFVAQSTESVRVVDTDRAGTETSPAS